MQEIDAKNPRRAMAFGLTTVLCWSTVATAFKLALRELDPPQLVLYAAVFSATALVLLLVLQGRWGLLVEALVRHPWRSLGLGTINPLVYYLVLFEAYDRLPAQVAQPVNYTWAITLALLAAVFLKQRLRRVDLLAAAVAYGGVVLLSMQGEWGSWGRVDGTGLALALVSTLIWSGYWLAAASDRRDPVAALAANFCMSLPGCLVACLLLSSPLAVSWQGLAGAAYIGCLEMGLTFALWVTALRLAPSAAQVSTLIFLSPPVSLLLIHWILGEAIHASTFAGLGLVLGGLGLQQLGRKSTSRGG
ncbi:MAG: DMT family transporter [Desulfovibrio sp.]|nr:DMT family transporter [Desulfovibrio sp.]